MNFGRITDENEVGNVVCQYAVGRSQRAFFRCFGQNDALFVALGTLYDLL